MTAIVGLLGSILCIVLGVALYGAIMYCYFYIQLTLQDMKRRRARNRIIRELKKYAY